MDLRTRALTHRLLRGWAGYALDGSSVAAGDLGPYIEQAVDQVRTFFPRTLGRSEAHSTAHPLRVSWQINFVIGDPTTSAPGIV